MSALKISVDEEYLFKSLFHIWRVYSATVE